VVERNFLFIIIIIIIIMIEKFQISNFKGFNEPLSLDIAPITLIFGPNSVGKSSIIEGLQMIKHSGPNDLQTYLENRLDLGRPDEILSRQNKSINPNITYSFSFNYAGLNKPKGPLLNNLESIGIKKNFNLTKDNIYVNNKISILFNKRLFFSLKLGFKTNKPEEVEKLNQLEGKIDLIDLVQITDRIPENDPFWSTSQQAVFTIDTISDNDEYWDDILNFLTRKNISTEISNKIDFVINERNQNSRSKEITKSELETLIKQYNENINLLKKGNKEIINFINKVIIEKEFKDLPYKKYLLNYLINNKKYVKSDKIISLLKENEDTVPNLNKKSNLWEMVTNDYIDNLNLINQKEKNEKEILKYLIEDINNKLIADVGLSLIRGVTIKGDKEYKFDINDELINAQLQASLDEVKKNVEKIDDINYSISTENSDTFKDFSIKKLRDINILISAWSRTLQLSQELGPTGRKEIKSSIIKDIKRNLIIEVEVKGSEKQRIFYYRKKNTLIDLFTLAIESNNRKVDNLFPNLEEIIDHCDSLIEENLGNFTFVPCFRSYERVYRSTRKSISANLDISTSTADLVETLSRDKELLKKLNDWLKQSTLNSEIVIEEGSDSRIMYVIEGENKVKINIADAGSGIRNLIPIIAVIINANRKIHPYRRKGMETKPIIALEEPEVNLHPRLQIDLASFVANFSNKRDFIIETHSELMMRKIQQLIRDKESNLTYEDVKVYCVRKNQEGHYVDEIRIDSNGKFLDEWPHGYFNERIELL